MYQEVTSRQDLIYGLDFKALGWTIALLPLLVLLGGPVEAYFVIRRRERLHEQLQEEQPYRWISLGASSSSFDNYSTLCVGQQRMKRAHASTNVCGGRGFARSLWRKLGARRSKTVNRYASRKDLLGRLGVREVDTPTPCLRLLEFGFRTNPCAGYP